MREAIHTWWHRGRIYLCPETAAQAAAPSGRGLEQLQPRQEAINRDSAQGLLRTVPCLGVLALSPETPAQSQCQTHPVELFSSSQSLQLLIPPHAPGEAKSSPNITQRPSSEHATPQEQDSTNTTTVQVWCDTVYSSPRFWISINAAPHLLGKLQFLLSLLSNTKGITDKPSAESKGVRTTALALLFPSTPLLQQPKPPQLSPVLSGAGANLTLGISCHWMNSSIIPPLPKDTPFFTHKNVKEGLS